MDKKEEILKVLSVELRTVFAKSTMNFDFLQEIRLRINRPLMVRYQNEEFFINKMGRRVKAPEDVVIITLKELRETMEYISNYSLYAFEDEIRQGFLTIQGGHRIGIAGKAVLEGEYIKNLKHISFLNIRLSHEIKGCADKVLSYLIREKSIYHTLIISPPGCGKTTLLRDLIRQLSDGTNLLSGMTVGVVDERSEIGACYLGMPQNDLGMRTDILDCCPKAEGMMMLIRSMSPKIIAVDEIGSKEDIKAMEYAMNCGCKMIATVHGYSIEDILSKPSIEKLVSERLFERFIILGAKKKVGEIESICDSKENELYRTKGEVFT